MEPGPLTLEKPLKPENPYCFEVHTAGLGAQNSVLQGLAQANAVTTGDGVRLLDSLTTHRFPMMYVDI